VARGGDGSPEVAERKVAFEARRVSLVFGDHEVASLSFAELGITVDERRTLATLARVGKDGSLVERVTSARKAERGEVDVPLALDVKREVGLARLEALKAELDRAPVAAKLDLDAHATIPGKDGAYIDVDGTLARVEALAAAGYANTKDRRRSSRSPCLLGCRPRSSTRSTCRPS
jgi:hypothetical protein